MYSSTGFPDIVPAASAGSFVLRYWWVNQNQTFKQEIQGRYLWSPKRKADGSFNHYYDTMRVVAPGDLVLSFQKTYVRAVGVVRTCCYESPKPAEFGSAGMNWSRIGWRIDVSWTLLRNQIRPKVHMDRIQPLLPAKYSPLRSNGDGIQSVYLTEIPQPLMIALGGLIGYEVLTLIQGQRQIIPGLARDKETDIEILKISWENQIEGGIVGDTRLPATEKEALVTSRRGQGLFRERVRGVERACRITHVDNPEHLIASHCKPWRHSSNEERLDGENGLLLTPSVDHLFDRGFISFEDSGRLLISPVADRRSLERMGIEIRESVNVGSFSSGQCRYLDFHRHDIFLQTR